MTIVLFGLSPIIVTLAMNGILEGVSLLFSSGAPIGKAPPALAWFVTGRIGGIAPIGWFLIVFVVAATLYLNRSAQGRRIFAVGNSQRVSRLSGVRIGFPIVGAYMLSGFCSALVGVFLAGFSGQAFFGMGDPYLLSSIAVVVLGRHPHYRGARPLLGNPGWRAPVHRAWHHALGHGAARGRAQHHLWPCPARRDRRASRARGHIVRSGSARTHSSLRGHADA